MRRFLNGNVSNLLSRLLKKVTASEFWDLKNLWFDKRNKNLPNLMMFALWLVHYLMALRSPRKLTTVFQMLMSEEKGRKTTCTCTCTELIEYKSQQSHGDTEGHASSASSGRGDKS